MTYTSVQSVHAPCLLLCGEPAGHLIDSAGYLLVCSRYIELNPVRTQRVGHARFYPWSSYRWHAEGKADALMTDHRLYRALGKTVGDRQRAYRELCSATRTREPSRYSGGDEQGLGVRKYSV